jgi:hypothetical protein
METIQHRIIINAPRERVYHIMLDDATYRIWTAPFHEGSYFEGTWDKGSKILFLGPEGGGVVSRIAENIPNAFVSIEHIGMVMNGVEDTTSDDVLAWAGIHENYIFNEAEGGTELIIELDANEEMKEMFETIYPRALEIVKQLSENAA